MGSSHITDQQRYQLRHDRATAPLLDTRQARDAFVGFDFDDDARQSRWDPMASRNGASIRDDAGSPANILIFIVSPVV